MANLCPNHHSVPEGDQFCGVCGLEPSPVPEATAEVPAEIVCLNMHTNPDGVADCLVCGVPLITEVTVCPMGHTNEIDAVFCTDCGLPIGGDDDQIPQLEPDPATRSTSEEPPTGAEPTERPKWPYVVGLIALVAIGAAIISFRNSNNTGEADTREGDSARWTGTATCTAVGGISAPQEVDRAEVRYTKADDFTLTITAGGPTAPDAVGSPLGFTFFGNNSDWKIVVYDTIAGDWQARLEGDIKGAAPDDYDPLAPGADFYLGDEAAVTAAGNTLTVTWPYGTFNGATDRSGEPLAIGAWSVQSDYGEESCAGGKPEGVSASNPTSPPAPADSTATSPATSTTRSATTALPTGYPTLDPATVPSAVPICDEPTMRIGTGFPISDCSSGTGINRQTWDLYAADFPALLALGPDATSDQIQSAACTALSSASTSQLFSVLETASQYYDWPGQVANIAYDAC